MENFEISINDQQTPIDNLPNNNNTINDEKKKKKQKNLTHFLNFPIEDSCFVDSYCKLCEDLNYLIEEGHLQIENSLLQKRHKLHITICVLSLETEEKIKAVDDMLTKISPEIQKIVNGKLIYNFEKYERMGSLNKTRVIYAKMLQDSHHLKIIEIVHFIIKSLLEEKIIENEELKEYSINLDKKIEKYTNLLHLTLMNITFLNREKKKKKHMQVYGFNSEKVLDILKEKPLPAAELTQINFSKMSCGKDGKYELVKAINLQCN